MLPLQDIVMIQELTEENSLSVSELSKGKVIKVGPEVKSIEPNDIVFFYKKNNRKIDTVYSYLFEEDCLFVEEKKKND
jgi:hypothetical protein